jgi:hypothetical protein
MSDRKGLSGESRNKSMMRAGVVLSLWQFPRVTLCRHARSEPHSRDYHLKDHGQHAINAQHLLHAAQTSEMSGLATYLVGALVCREQYWIATAITVISLFLLELKDVLEGLTKRIAPEEVLTFTKFLMLSAVILPILPNQDFGSFKINPFKTWVVVVAVSAISYASYAIQRMTKGQSGRCSLPFLAAPTRQL